MKQSTTRILTTHTGSLPRPQDMLNLLIDEQAGRLTDRTALDAAIQRAVAEVIQKQAEQGLDVINDGEQGRVDYTVYIKDRLTGFEGESTPPIETGDEGFPELAAILRHFASPFQYQPARVPSPGRTGQPWRQISAATDGGHTCSSPHTADRAQIVGQCFTTFSNQ